MPQFSDDLYLGPAFGGLINFSQTDPSPMDRGVGPLGRVYVYDLQPVAPVANNIVNNATTAGAGTLPLAYGANTSQANAGGNGPRLVFDVTRAVSIQSAGNLSGANFTVRGVDRFGQIVTQRIVGPNAATVTTAKAFRGIDSITVDAAVTGVNVGTSNTYGLPNRVIDANYVISQKWNGAADTGAFVGAVQTVPSTNLLGDVRGTYTPTTAADGTKRLVIVIAVPAIACGPQATRIGAFGVPQV